MVYCPLFKNYIVENKRKNMRDEMKYRKAIFSPISVHNTAHGSGQGLQILTFLAKSESAGKAVVPGVLMSFAHVCKGRVLLLLGAFNVKIQDLKCGLQSLQEVF